ncbi:MAG: MBOAT family protein [Pseudomonadota bacterium]
MLFHTQLFILVFLPVVLGFYYLSRRHHTLQQWLLVAASLIFYGYWDVRLIPLLIGSVIVNWLVAQQYVQSKHKWLIYLGVLANLALLGIFKYANFFAETFAALHGSQHQYWDIVLPLGISFFTFQQLSYLVDLNRGNAPLYSLRKYALYVTFFPQLIAGPIVRHNEILPQFKESIGPEVMVKRISQGLILFMLGVIKKVVVGDTLAGIVDPLYATVQSLSCIEAWIAAFGFSLQIYFDFSGYSDMAIGLGLMFGVILPENFAAPYRATSIVEFWRRWHMTLSRFLKDYLYIPLGGNRFGATHQVGALLVTMLLGGLWHGANWTFVIWGLIHGSALATNHMWQKTGIKLPSVLAWSLTFVVVVLAFALFRAPDVATAALLYAKMFSLPIAGEAGLTLKSLWILPVAFLIVLFGMTTQTYVFEKFKPARIGAVALGLTGVWLVLKLGGDFGHEFIYFQF